LSGFHASLKISESCAVSVDKPPTAKIALLRLQRFRERKHQIPHELLLLSGY